jgi:hypothetical protein
MGLALTLLALIGAWPLAADLPLLVRSAWRRLSYPR